MKRILLNIFAFSIRVLYAARDIVALVVMLFIALDNTKTEYDVLSVMCVALCIALYLAIIRWLSEWEEDYVRRTMYHERGRFTSLDTNGNPIIRVEDIPEIIEFLYDLEEGNE